jgi:hypothetical protein
VAVALVVLIFKLHNEDVSWVIGKFSFLGSALFTFLLTELMPTLKRHRLDYSVGLGCNLYDCHCCANQSSSDG